LPGSGLIPSCSSAHENVDRKGQRGVEGEGGGGGDKWVCGGRGRGREGQVGIWKEKGKKELRGTSGCVEGKGEWVYSGGSVCREANLSPPTPKLPRKPLAGSATAPGLNSKS